MAVVAKRSVMTLFSNPSDMTSHQIRIVLAEKGVVYEVEQVNGDQVPNELQEINPYGTVPTLVDRDLVLFEPNIIMEYLDERFPHPPLMPVYPVARARSRMMIYRFQRDWFPLVNQIQTGRGKQAEAARTELKESLITVAPVFEDFPYFLSEEFTLVDCALAPLLWRLPQLGIELSGKETKAVRDYMERVFSRDSFRASLTEEEREMRS
ncbi:MAG: stringent starvation protein A [Gammaproteobacteria bacterium]|nr:MAG: stringent starvation protein A [Gammaproteobacteria bacterium]